MIISRYSLFEITPKDQPEWHLVMQFLDKPGFDFFAAPKEFNKHITVLVAPEVMVGFKSVLTLQKIEYKVIIQNYEE